MVAALYGTGIRPGDRFFCPSSPAWGHGLWHGTLAPLALGVSDRRLCRQVRRRAAAAGAAGFRHHQPLGGGDALPHDAQVGRGVALPLRAAQALVHRRADRRRQPGRSSSGPSARRLCSMYGTTEIGVILANYPGARRISPSSRARSASRCPACSVEVQRPDGSACARRRDRRDQGVAPRRMVRRPRTSAASTRTATSSTPAAPTT